MSGRKWCWGEAGEAGWWQELQDLKSLGVLFVLAVPKVVKTDKRTTMYACDKRTMWKRSLMEWTLNELTQKSAAPLGLMELYLSSSPLKPTI